MGFPFAFQYDKLADVVDENKKPAMFEAAANF